MPERIAKVEQEYADRRINIGQTFQVEPQHVELLLRLGRIEPDVGEFGYVSSDFQAAESTQYQTRDMNADRIKRPYHRKAA